MRILWGLFYALSVLILLILMGQTIYIDYQIDRDITSRIEAGQDSSSFEEMATNLEKARKGLEKWGITRGHAALIFKTSLNDATLYYGAVKKVENRVKSLSDLNLDRNTTAYNATLSDLQQTLRAFEFGLTWHRLIHNSNFIWVLIFALILGALSGVLLLKSA